MEDSGHGSPLPLDFYVEIRRDLRGDLIDPGLSSPRTPPTLPQETDRPHQGRGGVHRRGRVPAGVPPSAPPAVWLRRLRALSRRGSPSRVRHPSTVPVKLLEVVAPNRVGRHLDGLHRVDVEGWNRRRRQGDNPLPKTMEPQKELDLATTNHCSHHVESVASSGSLTLPLRSRAAPSYRSVSRLPPPLGSSSQGSRDICADLRPRRA